MPLYDYRCNLCAHTFERRHGWSQPASAAGACPACGSDRIVRLLPTIAVQVKAGSRSSGSDDFAGEACSPQGCARPGCPSVSLN